MTCGPEMDGSSFLGGLAHPERTMRKANVINPKK
jgi:hypothetical protein